MASYSNPKACVTAQLDRIPHTAQLISLNHPIKCFSSFSSKNHTQTTLKEFCYTKDPFRLLTIRSSDTPNNYTFCVKVEKLYTPQKQTFHLDFA